MTKEELEKKVYLIVDEIEKLPMKLIIVKGVNNKVNYYASDNVFNVLEKHIPQIQKKAKQDLLEELIETYLNCTNKKIRVSDILVFLQDRLNKEDQDD